MSNKNKQVFLSSIRDIPEPPEATAYHNAMLNRANRRSDAETLRLINDLRKEYGLPIVSSLSECMKK